MTRRVVTGLNEQGRSCVVIDGEVPRNMGIGGMVWSTANVPADNSGNEDASQPFSMELMNGPGTTFQVVEFQPGNPGMMHATNTIDYVVVLSGAVTVVMEEDEVLLQAGDVLVQRGVMHDWRCDGPEPARVAVVTVPSQPVGAGRSL
jgi:quercetin dioxygenase-like cupin family protein